MAGLAEEQMKDLAWLGLDWDEGPDCGGPHKPYLQSQRSETYEAALRQLESQGLLFPCNLTRREVQSVASAPHGPETSPYPPALRPAQIPQNWLADSLGSDSGNRPSVRIRVEDTEVGWQDLIHGKQSENLRQSVGDFVLHRRDGVWAYQLAVVVDDAAMEVSQVVRGADLMSSTGRQIYLQRALQLPCPSYAHVPLLLAPTGEKLSKRDGALTVEALRTRGVTAEQLVGLLAFSLGLESAPDPRRPQDLIEHFSWGRIPNQDQTVDPQIGAHFKQGGAALREALVPHRAAGSASE